MLWADGWSWGEGRTSPDDARQWRRMKVARLANEHGLLDMKINAVRQPGAEIEVGLELVRFKKAELKATTEEYSEAA